MAQKLPGPIIEAWATLKTQLQKRTDIVFTLTTSLSKSKQVDTGQLVVTKSLATELAKYIDSLNNPDSLSVSNASILNSKLTQALSRSLVTLEKDTTFRNSNLIHDLLMQLEAIEDRIGKARRDYNIACRDGGRRDLWIRVNEYDEAPKVKF